MTASTRAFLVVLAVAGVGVWPGAGGAQEPAINSSVVQFFVSFDAPNLVLPWQTEGPSLSAASGVIIEGNRILTNAHVVEDAVAIEVKRADASERATTA